MVLNFRVTVSSLGSASGNVKIVDLPQSSLTLTYYEANGVCTHFSTAIPADNICIMRILSNSNEIQLKLNDTLGRVTDLQASELSTGTLYGQLIYRIA